jgi:dTDP-4-dehydrorhamnose reductase
VVKIKDRLTQSLPVNAVTDNLITPTFIDDIANGLKYPITNYSPETFHLVGQNSLSSFDFSQIIAKKFGLNSNLIQPISAVEYFKNKAARPLKAVIVSQKNNFWPMKTFEQGLDEIKKQLSF